MTIILAYILFYGAMAVSLFKPWIGVAICYLIAIWVPLVIWHWVFAGMRVFFYVALSTVLGFLVAAMRGKIDFAALRSKQNFYLIILWLCLTMSFLFSPIAVTPTIYAIEDPYYLIQNISKVILFYFVAILTINNKKKCHFLVWVIMFSSIHLIYWGHMQYFSGIMRAFENTLMGPGFDTGLASVYVDENAFAMLYVVSLPFLYFMGRFYKNKLIKYFLWLCIPFAWHCIFLTGSRGGILGLSAVTLYIMVRSKSKIHSLAIPVVLILAFILQAGPVMQRRAERALNIEEEGSAQSRFISWKVGFGMMIDHPVTGVGIGNFMRAFPYYSDTRPYVAHNTIIQLSAESGVLAGLMYLLLCFGILWGFFRKRNLDALNIDPFLLAVGESITAALAGFFVCGLFLNLATYEVFYYALALHSVRTRLLAFDMQKNNSLKMEQELI